ncbi:NRDE family protein [Mesonia aestuariivivens]|uniref:NRDE family protein n=1 Tax=Mesonia aestuariivivens TaxID=2796128 RepID=A0ABS6VZC6_9FLAO|nr:NRDE family protein [Mesonia aestuariivivens]MBW2960946.1 NRDE family protein [Mesonia aestuariivivens]
MCTVSFISLGCHSKKFIFTSNRDEASDRPTLAPRIYNENGVKLLYPKDKIAGGTWVAVSEKSKLICLMNGAEYAHERKASYKKSRGVVLKEHLLALDFNEMVSNYEYNEIEPFTIIYISWHSEIKIQQLVWDGDEVKNFPLEVKAHIWSASMTYNSEMKKERHQWFNDFIAEHDLKHLTANEVWEFHHQAGKDDAENGFIIDRGLLKTTSVTQLLTQGNKISMKFENLLKNEVTEEKLNLTQ